MTPQATKAAGVAACAHALCVVLTDENAALAKMDIPQATQLVAAKRSATDALMEAMGQDALPPTPDNIALADRLRALSSENKLLLERAMIAQNRVMACIARAIPRAVRQGGGYGAMGRAAEPHAMPAVALSSQV